MNAGSTEASPTRRRRRRARWWAAGGLLAVGVGTALLFAAGVIPWSTSSPPSTYRVPAVVVSFSGSGGASLCPETNGTPPTCGSAVVACDPSTFCNETLRSGEVLSIPNGVTVRAMLSDTFDCNYTYSIAAISAAGAFSVPSAQVNGAALPAEVGFAGTGGSCVTQANISVSVDVGNGGPSEQDLFLTVFVAEELR